MYSIFWDFSFFFFFKVLGMKFIKIYIESVQFFSQEKPQHIIKDATIEILRYKCNSYIEASCFFKADKWSKWLPTFDKTSDPNLLTIFLWNFGKVIPNIRNDKIEIDQW